MLGRGFDGGAVETAGGLVFRRGSQAERVLLRKLAPLLPVPIPQPVLGDGALFAYRKLAGGPVAPGPAPPGLGRQVGELLVVLHAIEPRGDAVLTHGDLWHENLLVEHDRLVGVLDWSHAGHAEPARDFAPLHYNGRAYVEAACRAYAERTGRDAAVLLVRSAHHLLAREREGLRFAQEHVPEEVPDAQAKLDALLRGELVGDLLRHEQLSAEAQPWATARPIR